MANVRRAVPMNPITPLTISSGSKPASKVTSVGNQKSVAKVQDLQSEESDLRYVQKDLKAIKSKINRGRSTSRGKKLVLKPSPEKNVQAKMINNRRQSKSPSPTKQTNLNNSKLRESPRLKAKDKVDADPHMTFMKQMELQKSV